MSLATYFALNGLKFERTYPIPSSMLHGKAEDFVIFKANGKGMYPEIENGDLLFCENIGSKNFRDGEIVVLHNPTNNKVACKHMRRVSDHTFFENSKKEIFEFSGYRPVARVSSIYRNILKK